MPRILVVEDEPGLQRTLRDRLGAEGFEVAVAGSAREAAQLWRRGDQDAVVLDIMLPDLEGTGLLRVMRGEGHTTPVLMLTARDSVDDKVVALGLGADDYLTKPFDPRELVARLRAMLRRDEGGAALTPGPVITVGRLRVDLVHREAVRDGAPVELSSTEWALLAYLIRHHGRTLTREELLREVWHYAPDTVTRTVDQHVAQLRQHLEEHRRHPRHLRTVHGKGYLLRLDPRV